MVAVVVPASPFPRGAACAPGNGTYAEGVRPVRIATLGSFDGQSFHVGYGDFTVIGAHVLTGREQGTAADTQAPALLDTTRTLSKVRARLDRVDDEWVNTDPNSTSGVVIVAADGTERVLDEGKAAVLAKGIGSSSFVRVNLAVSIAFDGPST